MTITEICDDLARRARWSKYTASNGIEVWERGGFAPELGMEPYQQSHAHPFPLTLDAAFGAIPGGFNYELSRCHQWNNTDGSTENAVKYQMILTYEHPTCDGEFIIGEPCESAIEAVYRSVHAAVVAMEKEKSNG